jgi:hypothetical protein
LKKYLIPSTLILLALFVGDVSARSAAEVRAFKWEQPCPSTGLHGGRCPGWIVDHKEPLCAGGADKPANMQWQTVADAKAKDKLEWALCRSLRKTGH